MESINWGMYAFGYFGVLFIIVLRLAKTRGTHKPSPYKRWITFLGSVLNIIGYNIVFAAGSESLIPSISILGIDTRWGYFMAAVAGAGGSALMEAMLHVLPWTGKPPDVINGIPQSQKKFVEGI